MIGIVDYGMGNLFSVAKALERLDVPYFISGEVKELQKADGLLLPGVGSFRDAMTLLKRQELARFIKKSADLGKPLLGICLGMQLLYEESEENGTTEGLGLLKGRIIRIPRKTEEMKIPHMGWNKLRFVNDSPLLDGLSEGHVYFVHSYYLSEPNPDHVLAAAEYGVEVPAISGWDNIFGMQFHPEKSGDLGMKLLRNFTRFVEKEAGV
ncbi:imidazole glycerol phosphate synthase subunit HisH [Bacillus salacetis]|uniref:Imidazole glycerol phosphate synthase subunit HisH n=1 Tax=Bacillus salacetis TaxID=2315464 RepID=A0A3A1R925_9BACI|nr:imidazole glycerol phosphate synthase subunit HisH [Bacillus salacetis]RIW38989.1 imidazole glycerol phosphate synthase subunit HisH [Bacillus salacetis]